MKVLYDISVLGIGTSNIAARTGIFRVVETVAEHLAVHKDCKLHFCSAFDYGVLKYSEKYLQQKSDFSHIPFSSPALSRKDKIRDDRLRVIDKVLNNNISIIEKIPLKVQIRAMWIREKFLGLTNDDSLIDAKDLLSTDIFHSTFFPIPKEVKKSKIKSIFLTSYDLIPILHPQFSEEAIRNVIINVLKSIDKNTWVLCISHATRNDLLNYMGNAIEPCKVLVTELAASNKFYHSANKELNKEVKEKYGIPDSPYILSLCTLEPRKNIDQAIRAFVRIVQQERIEDLNLVLVGAKGWMFDKIFDEIEASASVRDKIIITGYVADEHLAPLYSDALLFVYPTFYEGFGLPPLEAMQCGTPVITSNTSSLPEVVGDAGLMVSPTDLDALCGAMYSIYIDSSLRQQLSTKSLERARGFSWERCAQETVDAYKASLTS